MSWVRPVCRGWIHNENVTPKVSVCKFAKITCHDDWTSSHHYNVKEPFNHLVALSRQHWGSAQQNCGLSLARSKFLRSGRFATTLADPPGGHVYSSSTMLSTSVALNIEKRLYYVVAQKLVYTVLGMFIWGLFPKLKP